MYFVYVCAFCLLRTWCDVAWWCTPIIAYIPIDFLPGNTRTPSIWNLLIVDCLWLFGDWLGWIRKREAQSTEIFMRRQYKCGSCTTSNTQMIASPGKYFLNIYIYIYNMTTKNHAFRAWQTQINSALAFH